MKRSLRDAWVAALRSGEYKQGQHGLRSGDYHCCLGVLCEIHPNVTGKPDAEGTYFYSIEGDPNEYCTTLPRTLSNNEGLLLSDIQSSLINLNDNQAKDFNEIADWIEENVPVEED